MKAVYRLTPLFNIILSLIMGYTLGYFTKVVQDFFLQQEDENEAL